MAQKRTPTTGGCGFLPEKLQGLVRMCGRNLAHGDLGTGSEG